MKIVYIAGPFRGPTAWDIECNVRRAEEYGLQVARLGAMPLIPHANSRFFQGQGSDEFWLEGTMELLRRCDAVFLVPGWERSSGSRGEKTEAERLDLWVFQSLEGLQIWLSNV